MISLITSNNDFVFFKIGVEAQAVTAKYKNSFKRHGSNVLVVFQSEFLQELRRLVESSNIVPSKISHFMLKLVLSEPNRHLLRFLQAFERSLINCPISNNFLQCMEQELCLIASLGSVFLKLL